MLDYRARNGALAFTALAALALSAPAANAQGTLSSSTTAPTTDAFDVFQPLFNDINQNLNGGTDYTDNSGAPGQVFTTGAGAGQQLLSITVKGVVSASGFDYSDEATDFFGMRISPITGTTLGTPQVIENAFSNVGGVSLVPNDYSGYVTFTFSAPIGLTANTSYAFDVFTSDGFFALGKNPTPNPTGGSFNTTGSGNRNFNSNAVTFRGFDRTFYASIQQSVAVPEPGTFALALVGLVGFAPVAARRLRRGK